jgi:hypothetical protein
MARPSSHPARRLDAWVPWLGGLLLVVPVLVARYPPMTDLPLFEGELSLLRHWHDPGFAPPGLYELNLGRTTQLAFAVGLPFTWVLSTAATCKLLVSAAVVTMMVGAARLARHVGASPWAALLVAPVALGWLTFIGFLSYLLGTALWLLFLPELDRWTAAPSARRGAAASGVIVLLHFAHLASSACAVVSVVVLGLVRGFDRRTPLRLAPAALAVALAMADRRADRGLLTAAASSWEERGMVWPPFRVKFTMLGDYLFGVVGALPQLLVVALVAAAALLAVRAAAAAAPRGAPTEPAAGEGTAVRWRFAMLGVAFLAAYFVSPWAVGGGAYFDARFLPPAWLVGVVALAGAIPAAVPVGTRLVAACIPLAWLAVVWPVFADSDREQRAVAGLFDHVRLASAVAVLRLGDDGGQPYLRATAGNRVFAERGGRVLVSLAEAPRAPVLVAKKSRWDEAVGRIYDFGPEALVPAFDATRFRYLLMRIPEEDLARAVVTGLLPDYRVEATSGAWVLFESTHRTVPIDAPDAAPPPGLATLGERLGGRR